LIYQYKSTNTDAAAQAKKKPAGVAPLTKPGAGKKKEGENAKVLSLRALLVQKYKY
jgi:hypothetical protein